MPTYMYVNIICYDNIKKLLILIIHGTYYTKQNFSTFPFGQIH